MKHCRICEHYKEDIDECPFCKFSPNEFKMFARDDWDILNLDDDIEWGHIQLMNRLDAKGIECTFADMWTDNNMAFILGCKASTEDISRALNINKQSIYNDFEHCFIILNLFQEKYYRGLLENKND